MVKYYFLFEAYLLFIHTQRLVSRWLSCTKYHFLLLSFLPRIWARLDQTLGSSSIWFTVVSAVPAIHISAKPRFYAINDTTFTVCESLDLALQASNGRFMAISHFIDDQLNIILGNLLLLCCSYIRHSSCVGMLFTLELQCQ